jgi:serine/threonine-protein kinase
VSQLFKHSLDQLEATPIPGTENGLHPFFWPDGEWVGFQIRGPATLKKVPLSGGPPVLLAALPASLGVGGVGGVVGETDDVIFGSHAAGLFRVPAAGGEPEPLTTPDGQSPHRFPFVLPNGRGLLFTVGGMSASNQIAVLPSGAKSWRVLTSGTDAHYLPSGHVVFWRQGSLWAARFDLQRLQVLGEPIPVIQGVRAAPDGRAAGAWSADGSLVYFSPADVPKRTFVWVDRKGIESPLAGPPGPYEAMDLSPDETRVLLRYRPAYGAT